MRIYWIACKVALLLENKCLCFVVFRYANQFKSSPSHESGRVQIEELNRRNAEHSNHAIALTARSNILLVHKSAGSERPSAKEIQVDSDDDGENVSMAISEAQRPLSHASTATTKSIQDETISLHRSKSSYSIGQSSIEEIISPKSNTENLEPESEAIDTSLEHIQNESNEKLIAEDTNDVATIATDDSDTLDGAEKMEEIRIETQPERLLDAPFIKIHKPSESDELRSESETVSLTSTEESCDYQRANTKIIVVPLIERKANKPAAKIYAGISRRGKVGPAKTSPCVSITPKHKTTELFAANLHKFDKPREASNTCLNQLDSQTWEITMNGLQSFVRLIRHHPEVVDAHMHAYCVALARQVKNLRSQVSRSACQASAEFFQTHSKQLETECEDLATQLFHRTADTNKFLRADAFRALAAMCDNLPPTKVIQTILTRGATHQNAIVRTTTANLCSRIVGRLGTDKVFTMHREHRDKLIVAGANFLMEGSLDTRNNAKAFFKQLSTHPNYNRTLQEVIPPRIYRNIEKALRSIK